MSKNSESPSLKLGRVGGRPCVHITYDVMIDGVHHKKALPFVVGVLADLSGQPKEALPLRDRKAVLINRDNFNEVMNWAGPRLALRVPNRLTDPDTSLTVELQFQHIDDFEPTRVVEQIAPLKQLLDKRRELCQLIAYAERNDQLGQLLADVLANTEKAVAMARTLDAPAVSLPPEPGIKGGNAGESQPSAPAQSLLDHIITATPGDRGDAEISKSCFRQFLDQAAKPGQVISHDVEANFKHWIRDIDKAISSQLNEVMHHPDFQKLEGTWRGLHYLVLQTETGENLKIRVLNVTRKELFIDLETAVDFDQSILFKKIHDETYGWSGGEPYGLLMGDYQFGRSVEEVNLLKKISHIAAAAHAPFVAAASPRMFNMERFGELSRPKVLAKIFDSVEYAAWKSFRESADSRYVALTLPRVLCRLPYGVNFKIVEAFDFEESVDGADHDKFAWMSSAWAYAVRVTTAVSRLGWMARIRGIEGGGKVEGLPVHCFPTTDGDVALKCSTEVAMNERNEFELSSLGFLPLLQGKHQDCPVFLSAQSCHKPAKYFDPYATAAAELSAKLPYLLCASRFVQYLKVLARDKIGPLMAVAGCERWLNDWIQSYCEQTDDISGTGQANRPLSDARVQIKPVPGRPGWHKVVADLVPYFQFEDETAALRLEAEIPRIG